MYVAACRATVKHPKSPKFITWRCWTSKKFQLVILASSMRQKKRTRFGKSQSCVALLYIRKGKTWSMELQEVCRVSRSTQCLKKESRQLASRAPSSALFVPVRVSDFSCSSRNITVHRILIHKILSSTYLKINGKRDSPTSSVKRGMTHPVTAMSY